MHSSAAADTRLKKLATLDQVTPSLNMWVAMLTRLISSSFMVRFVTPICSSTPARPDVSGENLDY